LATDGFRAREPQERQVQPAIRAGGKLALLAAAGPDTMNSVPFSSGQTAYGLRLPVHGGRRSSDE